MSQDYKTTLHLPATDFPMRGDLPKREPAILERWERDDFYAQLRAHAKGRPLFLLHDGPPYANGQIHLGHAVNKILKDIIIKSKHLDGFDAPYIPGWDCHGLPIEIAIEKKYGKVGVTLDAVQFRQKCREYAAEQSNCSVATSNASASSVTGTPPTKPLISALKPTKSAPLPKSLTKAT